MSLSLLLLSALIPTAHAAALQTVGSQNPAIAAMWSVICNTLPFCALGAATAPQYFAGKVIAIVQSLISVIAIIMILYASIQISMNYADEGKLGQAKTIILYAIGGVILAMIGGTLMQYLLTVVFPQLFNG